MSEAISAKVRWNKQFTNNVLSFLGSNATDRGNHYLTSLAAIKLTTWRKGHRRGAETGTIVDEALGVAQKTERLSQ